MRSGDSLSSIAERYGVTVEAICQANSIENPNLIRVGQVLTIP
ncbi:MAG TPA: LysM domain-containing protein [Blastocatellia bacterium]|nr:LysM domain-containing protein [Blastocatellia bacterium]